MTFADRLLIIKDDDIEDVSALFLEDPEHFVERFEAACVSAVPWPQIRDAKVIQARSEALQKAQGLLDSPDLIAKIEEAITNGGYAGDVAAPMIAYFAITSRQLERPINVAFVGQSAAGKTETVDAAVELHPPEAVFKMEAGSERALIYNDESYEHRCVVVAEADSIPEDGPAASVVRSIADTNQASYDVVERDETTSKLTVRHIEKTGPTSVMTTSTRPPKAQLSTRMFEVSIPDDANQTRAIMQEQARRATGTAVPVRNVEPFHALQCWIGLQDNQEPVIPYAEVLSNLIPANQVRFRRDQSKVFTFIKTSALLLQRQRQRNAEGRLICTVEDYATALRLLAPTFDAVLADGVTIVIRKTVEAVPVGEEVSQADLAKDLGISKQTASYRVNRAIKDGWLINKEERRGYPARIERGTPLPDERSALPTVAEVIDESNHQTNLGAKGYSPPPPVVITCPECGHGDIGCHFDPDLREQICMKWFEVQAPERESD
jgi:MarR family